MILSNLHFLYKPLQSLTSRQPVYICTNEVFILYSKQIYSLIDFLCSCTLKIIRKRTISFALLENPVSVFFLLNKQINLITIVNLTIYIFVQIYFFKFLFSLGLPGK